MISASSDTQNGPMIEEAAHQMPRMATHTQLLAGIDFLVLMACRFAPDKDGIRRTVRLEMLCQVRMDGHLTGVTVIRAQLAQLQCDALLLTFRQVHAIQMHGLVAGD